MTSSTAFQRQSYVCMHVQFGVVSPSYQNIYVCMHARIEACTHVLTHHTVDQCLPSPCPQPHTHTYVRTYAYMCYTQYTYFHVQYPHHSLPSPHLSHCLKGAVPHLVQGIGKRRGQLVWDVHNDQLRRALRLHPRGSLGGWGWGGREDSREY